MKAYWNRRTPFFVVTDNTDIDGFDAYPVDIPERIINNVEQIQEVLKIMQEVFDTNPAPEECAQAEVDLFTELLDGVFDNGTE